MNMKNKIKVKNITKVSATKVILHPSHLPAEHSDV